MRLLLGSACDDKFGLGYSFDTVLSRVNASADQGTVSSPRVHPVLQSSVAQFPTQPNTNAIHHIAAPQLASGETSVADGVTEE